MGVMICNSLILVAIVGDAHGVGGNSGLRYCYCYCYYCFVRIVLRRKPFVLAAAGPCCRAVSQLPQVQVLMLCVIPFLRPSFGDLRQPLRPSCPCPCLLLPSSTAAIGIAECPNA